MILGLSSGLAHKTPEEWAKRLADIGARAVVFPVDSTADEEVIAAYEKAARDNDLVIAEVGVWRNTLSADPAEREACIQYAIEQLRLADRLHSRCCVNVLGTPCGPRWDGGYRGNFSKEYTIESMPWMIPTGPDEYLKLIKDVDRPEFGVHLDPINMITSPKRYFFNDEFLRECFDKLKGRICSCHLKDINLREEYTFMLEECACGKGTLDIELYAQLATKEDPHMPMIIEHLGNDEEYLDSLTYVQKRLGIS